MATPQELYDETKTRLDLNIAKLQMLEREIQEKVAEKNQLMQPIMEDQGALKQLEKLSDVVQTVESK
jgi:division protein CdvB (Snf7/Vps24/ESCRT-III family)|tara:strand:- start:512 stop:712 length:201 start_codon:yes stop_codon:yes gene_type:complete